MAFTDRKDKIKGHCDEVAQNLAQQRRDRSSPTHLGYCHSEATIIRLKVSSSFHITLTLAALVLRQALLVNSIIPPSTRLARSPHPVSTQDHGGRSLGPGFERRAQALIRQFTKPG